MIGDIMKTRLFLISLALWIVLSCVMRLIPPSYEGFTQGTLGEKVSIETDESLWFKRPESSRLVEVKNNGIKLCESDPNASCAIFHIDLHNGSGLLTRSTKLDVEVREGYSEEKYDIVMSFDGMKGTVQSNLIRMIPPETRKEK